MSKLTSGLIVGVLTAATAIANHYGHPALGAFFSDPATAGNVTNAIVAIGSITAGLLKGWKGA